MIDRDELSAYLEDYLACSTVQDYVPNGLQIEGKKKIQRICTAVTASKEVIHRAIALQADALLVHHGFFWRGESVVLKGMKRQRIAELLRHDVNLFAYHLPLDCHSELGNNACIGRLLEAQNISQHLAGHVPDLLWSGRLQLAMKGDAFTALLHQLFQQKPLHISGQAERIQNIAWCSGAAQDYIEEAHRLKVDAYISGEVSERTYYQAKELGIHYYACGHHATERFGIQALGEWLSHRMELNHQFLDSDNPV